MKRGCVTRKGTRWYPVISINGKQKWLRGSDSKEEAHRILVATLNQINEGSYQEPSKILFSEFGKRYLDHMKPNLKPSSLDT